MATVGAGTSAGEAGAFRVVVVALVAGIIWWSPWADDGPSRPSRPGVPEGDPAADAADAFAAVTRVLIGGALALAPQRWLDAMSSLPAKLHAAANAQSQTNPYETGSYVFAYDAVLREVRVPDVTLTFSRVSGEGKLPAPVKTDQNGQWKQSGFELGTTYRVTPSLADYVFLPPAKEFNNSLEVGINPIIGYEAYLAPGDRREKTNSSWRTLTPVSRCMTWVMFLLDRAE